MLPLEIAAAARASGRPVHIVGIEDFAPEAISAYPHERVNLGQVGRMIRSFRNAGCQDMVIAGALRRPNLWKVKIDSGFFRSIGTVLRLTRGGDDSVLRRIVRFFELQGFSVRGVPEVAPHLLAPAGVLGKVQPAAAHRAAIARASAFIRALGDFDVGQGAVVSEAGIIAVEGVRGTDGMLEDVAEHGKALVAANPAVLVKLAKPGQEMRIDLPVIGPETIERAHKAGLAGIAIGAGQSLLLQRDAMLCLADEAGLFVVGLDDVPGAAPDSKETKMPGPLRLVGRRAPTPSDRVDIALGRRLMDILVAHEAGHAAVIAGEHVLAVNGALPVPAMLRRIGGGSHWGRTAFRKQIGVLAVRTPAVILGESRTEDEEDPIDFGWIADAGLAGVVCTGGEIPADLELPVAAQANARKLFLMMPAQSNVPEA
jgi:DUF1009 family protein